MRSPKSRSRGKSGRNRQQNNGGNVVNRVFDSSGPEGKVRGTPQQIIDKYNQLTRDAQLSNDRVAAENFSQHAEHYTRMLAVAQRETDTRREQQEVQNRERQQQRDAERAERQERHENRNVSQPNAAQNGQPRSSNEQNGSADLGDMPQPDLMGAPQPNQSGLVDTPETKPRRNQNRDRNRRPKYDKPIEGDGETTPKSPMMPPMPPMAQPAAETPRGEGSSKAKATKKPRARSKPTADTSAPKDTSGTEAAE